MSRATITTTTKQAGKILEWKELNKFIQTKKKNLINGQTNPQSRIRLFNKTSTKVIINGDIIGYTEEPNEIINIVKESRKQWCKGCIGGT